MAGGRCIASHVAMVMARKRSMPGCVLPSSAGDMAVLLFGGVFRHGDHQVHLVGEVVQDGAAARACGLSVTTCSVVAP